MTHVSADTFWAALEHSGLLPPERLAAAVKEAAALGDDGMAVARRLVKLGLVTRWQAEQLLAGHINLELGKYRLLERIGRGGMGAVYRAKHLVMGREVALKVMSPTLLNNPTAVARFQREVQSAASLNHPHIVAAYDADCVGKTHFLVMEFVEGSDLKHWLEVHGPLPIAWTCECIRQAAVGLQHAHERGMVHRDLKPSNLLLASTGSAKTVMVKILDMGLARFADRSSDDSDLTHSGQVIGTPDYIAPEQVENTRRTDIRADIYSLGCTLFCLLTGTVPFPGETVMSRILARLKAPAPPINSRRADIPADLAAVIAKMLATDPAARYQTPAEVAAALAPFAAQVANSYDETIALSTPSNTPTLDTSKPASETELELHEPETPGGDLHSTPAGNGLPTIRIKKESSPRVTSAHRAAESADGERPPGTRRRPAILVGVAAAGVCGLALLVFEFRPDAEPGAVSIASSRAPKSLGVSNDPDLLAPAATGPQPGTTAAAETAGGEQPVPAGDAASSTALTQIPPSPTLAPVETRPPPETRDPAIPANDSPAEQADPPATTSTTPAPEAQRSAKPSVPRTLIVGAKEGQLPDLAAACAAAQPGDTIVIDHPGPLEFPPLDLTGKTPLTIMGGTDGNPALWPLLRQVTMTPIAEAEAATTPPTALFQADQLDLTIRQLHLAVAGPRRAKLDAVFRFSSGRVVLEQSTFTVGVQGKAGDPPGDPLPLIRTSPSPGGPVEITLDRSFLRGARLESCLIAESPEQLDLRVEQTIWAGGPAPWLKVRGPRGPVRLELRRSTLYGAPSLIDWDGADVPVAGQPLLDVQTEACMFVGPFANESPWIVWNPSRTVDLAAAAASGLVRWSCSGNLYHRVPYFFNAEHTRRGADVDKWRDLWKQSSPNAAQVADPMFRVWPEGYVLQVVEPRDFQPRFWRHKRSNQRSMSRDVGAPLDQLTSPGPLVFDPAVDVSRAARGRPPQILRVHQRDGPYQTIEAALSAMKDGDVIEIGDDGPYFPRRNFSTHPAPAILFLPTATSFTLRAAEGANPTIVLDESVQQGALPAVNASTRAVFLMHFPMAWNIELEGIHFRFHTRDDTRRSVSFSTAAQYLRCTNCTIVDDTPGLGGQTNGGGSDFFAHGLHQRGDAVVWLENSIFFCIKPDRRALDLTGGTQSYLHVTNCLSQTTFCRKWSTPLRVTAQHNTFLGIVIEAMQAARVDVVSSTDNLVLVPPGTAMSNVVPLPVPPVTTVPRFEGASTAKDPYRAYRLRKGQPAATMASDGGPLGVRDDYLPVSTSPPP